MSDMRCTEDGEVALQDLFLRVEPECQSIQCVSHAAKQLCFGARYLPHRFYSVEAQLHEVVDVKLVLPDDFVGDCPHCGTSMADRAGTSNFVPAVYAYDPGTGRSYLHLAFCRPCCAYGFLQQCMGRHAKALITYTYHWLQRARVEPPLGLYIAPPRHYHVRYGGPLGDAAFYGQDADDVVIRYREVTPPASPYAAFLEARAFPRALLAQSAEEAQQRTLRDTLQAAGATRHAKATLPLAKGVVQGLRRIAWTKDPGPQRTSTGMPPEYIEFLRQRGLERLRRRQQQQEQQEQQEQDGSAKEATAEQVTAKSSAKRRAPAARAPRKRRATPRSGQANRTTSAGEEEK